jgi:hypothetical protein
MRKWASYTRKILSRAPLVLGTALVATAESAYRQQPPAVVTSDFGDNSAMGTSTLLNLRTGARSNK